MAGLSKIFSPSTAVIGYRARYIFKEVLTHVRARLWRQGLALTREHTDSLPLPGYLDHKVKKSVDKLKSDTERSKYEKSEKK